MTTMQTLTDAQIETLATEAAAAGDTKTWLDCEKALNDDNQAARKRIVRVIRNAEAQR